MKLGLHGKLIITKTNHFYNHALKKVNPRLHQQAADVASVTGIH